LAADAVVLLEIDDAVLILHDRVLGRTRSQAPWIGAMHALILAHEPGQRAVFALVLHELDQVPIIPRRFRHRLIGVLKRRLAKRQIVPLQARDLAGLASDAGSRIDQFRDPLLALGPFSRRWSGVSGNALYAKRGPAHPTFSSLTRKPLNSGVKAFGSIT